MVMMKMRKAKLNLKIVPYCVIKNPSEPSCMYNAMRCISSLPGFALRMITRICAAYAKAMRDINMLIEMNYIAELTLNT